jgi:hypothetical protein
MGDLPGVRRGGAASLLLERAAGRGLSLALRERERDCRDCRDCRCCVLESLELSLALSLSLPVLPRVRSSRRLLLCRLL